MFMNTSMSAPPIVSILKLSPSMGISLSLDVTAISFINLNWPFSNIDFGTSIENILPRLKLFRFFAKNQLTPLVSPVRLPLLAHITPSSRMLFKASISVP